MVDFYEVLGISVSASIEEVKAAYRSRAQASHPDRQGGSTIEFQQVREAYEVLSDPERRGRYDAGLGSSPQEVHRLNSALRDIAILLQNIVETSPDIAVVDIVGSIRSTVNSVSSSAAANRICVEDSIRRLEQAASRVHVKGDSCNILRESLLAQVARKRTELDALGEQQKVRDKILEIVEPYFCDVVLKPSNGSTTATGFYGAPKFSHI